VARDLIDLGHELHLEILVIPGFYDGITPEASIEYLGDFPVVSLHRRDEKVIAAFLKRVSDVVLSVTALLVALPMLLAIAIAIKLDSAGPVFYVSDRIGKKGRVFRCLKFRTMVADAEMKKLALVAQNERSGGILFKMKNDPRVTRVGARLRKYSLDEIPQFVNVLRGEMSLVGPRPPLASEVAKYELEHYRRLEVLPGLTGLWQVRARQDPSFERYVALDLAYVENWSFWLDIKILIRTTEVVFRGTGS
jgi:exopolysaccharide biosynthesis polyprenyl glycosylphosphotransferase